MRVVACLIVSIVLAGCDDSGDSAMVDPLIHIEEDDPHMAAAVAEARERWPEFVKAFNNPESNTAYAVKFPFETKGGGYEYIWIQVEEINQVLVTGVIDNEPVGEVGYNYGDHVTRNVSDLNDWLIANGPTNLIGGFTIKVLEETDDGP